MQQRFYLDTCIWRDYYENRSDRFRPLGDWALELINDCVENNDLIICSDMVLNEPRNDYSETEIEAILDIVKSKKLLLIVNTSEAQAKETVDLRKCRKVSSGDILHAILARDNNAILVTRDKHFYELLDIVAVKKPEELI